MINGNVVAFGAGDSLALGGVTDDSFDVSQIGAAAQFRNFGIYEKTGPSTWILTGTTAAVTPWTLRGGTLQVSADGNLGAASGGLAFDGGTLRTTSDIDSLRTVALAGAGTLLVDGGTTPTLGGIISGTGTLTKQGAGSLVLTGDNTYGGGTTISAGTLRLGDGGTSGSIIGDVANAATLEFDRSDNALALGGVISGNGTVRQIGNGTTSLTGNNTYTGATTIAAGTLALSGNGGITQSSGVEDNGTFDISGIAGAGTLITTLSGSGLVQLGGKSLMLTAAGDTFAGAIQGTGTLRLASGSETLTGISTYTGNTYVQGGELRLADGGQMLDTTNTHVAGVNDAALTVSGSGTLWSTKTLSFGAPGTDPAVVAVMNIDDGARLAVTATSQVNVAQFASATVNVSGPGSTWDTPTVILNNSGGTNNIQGIVNVTDGGLVTSDGLIMGSPFSRGNLDAVVLVAGAGSTWTIQNGLSIFKGDMSVLDGGRVTAASGTMNGTATHPASLLVSGIGSRLESAGTFRVGSHDTATLAYGGRLAAGGTVTLTGTLNIGGAAGAAATGVGVLDADTLAFGGSTGTLNFNHTDTDYVFDTAMSGAGTINQAGPGRTTLTADRSAFSGLTQVQVGILSVNGMLGGTMDVLSGGRLQGNGTIGVTTVNAGGTIAPGNSIGTLHVAGNYTQAAGAVYQAEVDPASSASDQIDATGSATLAPGAVLDVVKTQPGAYQAGTKYTVLSAAGGLTGTYDLSGDTGSAFLSLTDTYDADHAYLEVKQIATLPDAADTGNEKETAGGVSSLPGTDPVAGAALMLPDYAAARDALDRLSGEIYASSAGCMLDDSRFVREAALDRTRAAFDCDAGTLNERAEGNNSSGISRCTPNAGRATVWARSFGSWGGFDGDGNAAALDRDIGGLLIGADVPLAGNWRVGGLFGFSRSHFSVDARNSSAWSDDYHAALYGATQRGALALRLGAAYVWHDIDGSRSVVFPGIADTEKADYHARTAQVSASSATGSSPAAVWRWNRSPDLRTSISIATVFRSTAVRRRCGFPAPTRT